MYYFQYSTTDHEIITTGNLKLSKPRKGVFHEGFQDVPMLSYADNTINVPQIKYEHQWQQLCTVIGHKHEVSYVLVTITVHNAANPKTPPSPLSCSWPLSSWCCKSSPRAKSSAKYKFSLPSWQLGWLCEEALRHTTWKVVHLLFLEFWVSQLRQTLHHFYTSYTHARVTLIKSQLPDLEWMTIICIYKVACFFSVLKKPVTFRTSVPLKITFTKPSIR